MENRNSLNFLIRGRRAETTINLLNETRYLSIFKCFVFKLFLETFKNTFDGKIVVKTKQIFF